MALAMVKPFQEPQKQAVPNKSGSLAGEMVLWEWTEQTWLSKPAGDATRIP